MKMKMVTALFVLSLGTTASFAQTGASDGSRFGHGEDSIRCLKNISIYTEYVKTNNFKDAYTPWMSVFTEAPKAQVSTYTNGAKILRALIAGEKDAAKQKQYFNELMKVHDQRIQYLDDLNKLVKRDATKGSIIGMKAHDYFTMGGQDMNEAYNMFKEAIELEKENSDYFVLQEFMDAAARKMKSDEAYKEQFIQDYLFASGVADGALKAATKENDKKLLKVAKDNIDAFFINSGVATCDNLQAIYAPKVEQNKTNLDYLKQVISVMQMLNCTEQEAYFAASEAAHAIEPTAETAVGCGYMYYKKGDMDKCIDYFDQAINLEQDPLKKADYAYKTAAILFSKKQLSKAKQYALKSISLDGNNGKPYILIANMYASSPNWSDEAALNKCTYFAVIDKLQKAKSVDPSVAEEANKLIGTYAAHTPKDADLFFLSLKKGDSVTIGGWIGETTTIRESHFIFLNITVAIWATVMFVLFPACSGGEKNLAEAITERDSLPSMKTLGVTTLISDSGITRYKIITEEWEIYDKKNPPYWAFEKGVYLEKFDSLFHIDASIKADTAYYYEKKKLWELRSNVHIRSQRGDKFDTDLLFWDEKQERVYSDKFIRIEQEDKIITGYGFESNQQMTEYQIYNNTGIFTVEDTAPADSTKAVANSTRTDSIR